MPVEMVKFVIPPNAPLDATSPDNLSSAAPALMMDPFVIAPESQSMLTALVMVAVPPRSSGPAS